MIKDYSREIKNKIKDLKDKGFELGKSEKYLKHRTGASFKEMEKELQTCKNLVFTEKRGKDGR